MAQKIIDLDKALPEALGVRIEGTVYNLPGDIPIPKFLEIERLVAGLNSPDESTDESTLERLYEMVLELFREEDPELEELPLGPHRLGALVVQLYGSAGDDGDAEGGDRPTRSGTPSTSKTGQKKRSRGSR